MAMSDKTLVDGDNDDSQVPESMALILEVEEDRNTSDPPNKPQVQQLVTAQQH
jgi:hypothetical protein